MKEIKIGNTTYPIACNALTYISFKKVFNKGIYEDINVIRAYMLRQIGLIKQAEKDGMKAEDIPSAVSNSMINDLSEFIESITRIAYILIYTANKDFISFEEWCSTFNPNLQDDWISEVAEVTVDCFC